MGRGLAATAPPLLAVERIGNCSRSVSFLFIENYDRVPRLSSHPFLL